MVADDNGRKSLTARYSLIQFIYWAAASGTARFSAVYLLDKGISAAEIGIILAAAGIISCLTQPLLASAVDRAKKDTLVKVLILINLICLASFALQMIPNIPAGAIGIMFMVGLWSSDVMISLINALCCVYDNAGYKINYGIGRGIGAVGTATSSLVIGYIISLLGGFWMLMLLAVLRAFSVALLATFPNAGEDAGARDNKADTSCTIVQFVFRYKWFTISLLGILSLGMFHSMTETYLINIMERVGGDASNVGVALFIASLAATPVVLCFNYIRQYIKDEILMEIAAVTFLMKSILFLFASSIIFVYALGLTQLTSYAFLAPAWVFYANKSVGAADQVKGQAFVVVAYSLGCAFGNFAGGELLTLGGTQMMLYGGVVIAAVGTIILFMTVNKKDFTGNISEELTACE